jgi:L-threonylcarbamoyladenylate synthase
MRVTLEQACDLLKSGLVIGVPTETVYGLAASIDFPDAIGDIFRLKGRPADNPLIVHAASQEEVSEYVKEKPPHFEKLAASFWPGPMTLVLPAIEERIPAVARAGLPTAAFRVPVHSLTLKLLRETGPLVMPSANLSGRPSATSARHVEEDFGSGFSVLDGGACQKGMESTILCWNELEWVIIRLGALPPEAFVPVLGYLPKVNVEGVGQKEKPLCPGQLYRHYSPKAKLLLLDPISEQAQGVVVGFSDRHYPKDCRVYSLGGSENPEAAAQQLYAILRQLDADGIQEAMVDMAIPSEGLWLTLRERLQKAAAP